MDKSDDTAISKGNSIELSEALKQPKVMIMHPHTCKYKLKKPQILGQTMRC